MITLTQKEKQILEALEHDSFYEEGYESTLWTDCFTDTDVKETGLSARAVGGVLSSFAQKGVLNVSSGRDGVITLEPAAVEYLESLKVQKPVENYPEPTAEELFEMRAAFGEGTKVVNILTGKTIQL